MHEHFQVYSGSASQSVTVHTARGHWAMGTVQIRQLILVGPEEEQRSSCGLMMWEREGGLSAGRGSVQRRRAQCRGGRPTSSDRAAGSVPPLCRGSGLSAAASARHCAGAAGSVPPLCPAQCRLAATPQHIRNCKHAPASLQPPDCSSMLESLDTTLAITSTC